MGMYNLLQCSVTCPHCGHSGNVEVEMKLGQLDLAEYRIGDRLAWSPGRSVERGARPESGTVDGDGYVECPVCGRDYFLVVQVISDRIVGVRVDADRPGYIK